MWSITDVKWITEMLDPDVKRMCQNVHPITLNPLCWCTVWGVRCRV